MSKSSAHPGRWVPSAHCLRPTALLLLLILALSPRALAGVMEWETWWNGGVINGTARSFQNSAAEGPTGDYFVAGEAQTPNASQWIVLRLDPEGEIVWTWTGVDDFRGTPRALVISNSGDLYVTGSLGLQCGLVKLSAAGELLWYARDSNSGTSGCSRLVVDNFGRPYVASSNGSWQVAAYDVDGSLRWQSSLAGTYSTPVAMEMAGNRIYLAGTNDHHAAADFLLASLRASDGSLNWSTTWDGSGAEDAPKALAVLGGSAYVAGRSDGTDADLAVVRFSVDDGGFESELIVDSGADETALDLARVGPDLVVSGVTESGDDGDLLMRRLSPELATVWSDVYDGGDDESGDVLAISEDETEIFVAGIGRDNPYWGQVHRYSADGTRAWSTDPSVDKPRSLVVGMSGLLVTGETGSGSLDILMVELDGLGQEVWRTVEPDLVNSNDEYGRGRPPATPWGDGLAVVANSTGVGPAVLAYGSDGEFLGNFMAGVGAPESEELWAVAADDAGRIFTLGRDEDRVAPDSGLDMIVRGFDVGGALSWTEIVDAGSTVVARAAAAHPQGGVVVGASVTAGGRDYLVNRYDVGGSLLWSRQIDRGFGLDDYFEDLAVDAQGRIFAVGSSETDTAYGCYTVALDENGSDLWSRLHQEHMDFDEECWDLAVLSDGRVAITLVGNDFSAGGAMLLAYEPATGAEAWRVPGDPSNPLALEWLAPIDTGGAVALSADPEGLVRVDAAGNVLWEAQPNLDNYETSVIWNPAEETVIVSGENVGDLIYDDSGQIWGAIEPRASEASVTWIRGADSSLFRLSNADTVGDVVAGKLGLLSIFADGFESGDTSAWSRTTP